MKNPFRALAIAALAAVGATLAHSQTAYSSGLGYASAYYYQSQAGLYFTASGGQYYSYYATSVGSAWYTLDYYYGGFPEAQWSEAYGSSGAWAQPGGSGVYSYITSSNYVTISNLSTHYDLLTVKAYTSAGSYASANSWQDYAYDYSLGEFYDSAGLIVQYSETGAFTLGLGYGGNSGYAYSYDPYNGFFGVSASFGSMFPYSVSASASDFQYYYLLFGPGASDTFYTYAYDPHEAYSITPGPAAVAPFALGLIGALRRRKKA